jgi:hypothetical protein
MKIKEATILVTRRQKLGIIIHEQNNNQGLDSGAKSSGGSGNRTRDPVYNLIFRDKFLVNTLWIVFARGTLKLGIRVSACC